MPGIDESLPFHPLNIAVLTVSDTRDEATDKSGALLVSYTFDKDTQGSASNCYDKCAENWPPLIAPADTAVDGDFTLIDRTDGTKIVAYKGWPLYLWVKDQKPGDTTGDMVGEVWHTAYE